MSRRPSSPRALCGGRIIETVTTAQFSGVRPAAGVRQDARILVVDDDPNVSGLVGTILGNSGFYVESAVDAVSAMALIGQRRASRMH